MNRSYRIVGTPVGFAKHSAYALTRGYEAKVLTLPVAVVAMPMDRHASRLSAERFSLR